MVLQFEMGPYSLRFIEEIGDGRVWCDRMGGSCAIVAGPFYTFQIA